MILLLNPWLLGKLFCPVFYFFELNFGESGSRFKVHSLGEYQTSGTKVKSKFHNDNPKLCSHEAQILAPLKFSQIPLFAKVCFELLNMSFVNIPDYTGFLLTSTHSLHIFLKLSKIMHCYVCLGIQLHIRIMDLME